MALVPRLDLRQVQSLVMTPQLQQAIKLLQLSNLELSEYVERELEQNPLLEREDSDGHNDSVENQEDRNAGTDSETAAADTSGDEIDITPGDAFDNDSTFGDAPAEPDSQQLVENESISLEHDAGLDADYENVWSGDTGADAAPAVEGDTLNWQVQGAGGFDSENPALENAPAD